MNKQYTPLSVHSHYSLMKALTKSDQIASKVADFGISAVALTDFNSLSGSVDFFSDVSDKKVKPIIGAKFFYYEGFYITILAKNYQGWLDMVSISTSMNENDFVAISKEDLERIGTKNLICILHSVTGLNDYVIKDKQAYINQHPENYLTSLLIDDYAAKIEDKFLKFKELFEDRLFFGVNRLNDEISKIDKVLNAHLTYTAKKLGIKICAMSNVYYDVPDNHRFHNMLLTSGLKTTIENLRNNIETNQYAEYSRFFYSKEMVNGHIMSYDQMSKFYTEEELANTMLVESMCENFSILDKPSLPTFKCPNGMTERDYLRQLAREGWLRLKPKLELHRTKEYVDRINYELQTFEDVHLEGYFLIVQDFVNWARSQGALIGCSRGSAGGCLTSYLTGITTIDPIFYELIFERFYNPGRNSPGKVSYPDIDIDFPVYFRESVIDHVANKYGRENVAQVTTFSRLQGRGAIKEILRVFKACPQDMMNQISKRIPQQAEIADKMQEQKEKSILRWTLHNQPDAVDDWCKYNPKTKDYEGEFATFFKDAIEIEGTFKSYGKHASALIISDKNIRQNCPMLKDKKSGELICGIDFESLELMGFVKFDILGTAILDKLMAGNQLLQYGKINHNILKPIETEENIGNEDDEND